MGLNTNVVVFHGVPEENYLEFSRAIIKALNFDIIKEHQNLDWSAKFSLLYENYLTIAVTYSNGCLILEDYTDKFSYYQKPCILQHMSHEYVIGAITISSTTDTSSYTIYKGGRYFSTSSGMEEFDEFLAELDEADSQITESSCLVKDEGLQDGLTLFQSQFDYDSLFEKKFVVVEVIDQEEIV